MANRLEISTYLLALTAVAALAGGVVGFRQGLAAAPSRHQVEVEEARRAAIWDRAFLEAVDDPQTQTCAAVFDLVRDRLSEDLLLDQESRSTLSPQRR